MGADPMSSVADATRRRPWRAVLLALAALTTVAALSTYLTAQRPGPTMDPATTSPEGAHALVTLLGEQGVQVMAAHTIAEAESAAHPGTLLVVAQTQFVADSSLLERLARTPSDLLLVEPTSRARATLAPLLRLRSGTTLANEPNCALPEANKAGAVRFGPTDTYQATENLGLISCYDGALVRYSDNGRTVTVVGSGHFMTNSGLLQEGNAALAMNLAGNQARVIWYAPHRIEGERSSPASISEMIPPNAIWAVGQLCLVVLLVAVWQGRRIGPLVTEELPTVVRASETVEGRGRLYRSRRARDRAAAALRAAALQRLLPRLGLNPNAAPPAVVTAVTQRNGADAGLVSYYLFGPPPTADQDLLHLARTLDDIERQVTDS